ncbi:MAG TPA: hypothetical protein VGJ39_15855 [Vicinamibacterales bacterium]|jgi:hypothetical protein
MDYNLDMMLIALVAHREFDGGGESSVTDYATDLFNRYNAHIVKAANDAGLTPLDADQRSVIAAIAPMVPGTTAKDRAKEAVANYVMLLAS